MFQQIGEWYSATALKTDDAKLTARKAAGESLIIGWGKAPTPDLLNAVAYGLEILSPLAPTTNPASAVVCAAIVDAQPSFSAENEAGTLDPRLCALVTLSELINRRIARPGTWRRTEREVVIAEAIVAGLRLRDLSAGDFLHQRLNKLYESASALLDHMDTARRIRRGNPAAALASLKSKTDVAGVRDALHDALQIIFKDVVLDREELQALWWVFGGVSQGSGDPFTAMTPEVAAITAGYDLAQITAWPGTLGMSALAARACGSEAPFESANLSPEPWSSMLPDGARKHVRSWPVLFPLLTAIANSVEGKVGVELALRTPLKSNEAARQAYAEFSLLGVIE